MSRIIRQILRQANVIFAAANSTMKAYDVANTSVVIGGSAYNKANAALANSTVTYAGDLTVSGNVNILAGGGFTGFGSGFSNANFVTTTGSGTWTVPDGVKRFKVTLVGGGGGGGNTQALAAHSGSGGGTGAVTIKFYNTVSGTTTLSYNVGVGGTGGGTGTAAGGMGGNSNISYSNTWAFANGGLGGGQSASGSVSGGAGGGTSGGEIGINGFTGFSGGIATASNSVLGRGATTPFGWGAGGAHLLEATGGSGEGYGSGGGGGRSGSVASARSGGAGAQGVILIEW